MNRSGAAQLATVKATSMSRTPFQVIVIPFHRSESGKVEYVLFRRNDSGYWQGITGGGKDEETTLDAAKRAAWEEVGVLQDAHYIVLDMVRSVPVGHSDASRWGEDVFVIPSYSFGVEMKRKEITLSA